MCWKTFSLLRTIHSEVRDQIRRVKMPEQWNQTRFYKCRKDHWDNFDIYSEGVEFLVTLIDSHFNCLPQSWEVKFPSFSRVCSVWTDNSLRHLSESHLIKRDSQTKKEFSSSFIYTSDFYVPTENLDLLEVVSDVMNATFKTGVFWFGVEGLVYELTASFGMTHHAEKINKLQRECWSCTETAKEYDWGM